MTTSKPGEERRLEILSLSDPASSTAPNLRRSSQSLDGTAPTTGISDRRSTTWNLVSRLHVMYPYPLCPSRARHMGLGLFRSTTSPHVALWQAGGRQATVVSRHGSRQVFERGLHAVQRVGFLDRFDGAREIVRQPIDITAYDDVGIALAEHVRPESMSIGPLRRWMSTNANSGAPPSRRSAACLRSGDANLSR